MSFNFGSAATTTANTFGTATPSTGFSFGGGDPSKPLFGAPSAENKPAFNFSSPTTKSGSFTFGSKSTAATSSMFGSPGTASAGSAFGAIKPGGFDGMMAPPNQTVGSPGFGQPATQNAAQNLSFGGMQQQQAPPAFGTPTTQAASSAPFGSPSNSGFAFNKPAATAFSFATPASGFSAPQQAATSTTSTAPQTTQSGFGATTSATLSLGQTSAFGTKSAFTFGGGPTSAAPAFGSTTTSAAPPPPFGASPSGGFALPGQQPIQPTQPQAAPSFGTATSAPLSFGGTTAVSAASAFGAKPGFQTQGVLGFGSTAAPAASMAQAQPTLSFASPAASTQQTQPSTGLSFAPPSSQPPAFGTTGTAPTQPSVLSFAATSAPTGLSFTTPATSLGFATPAASQPAPLSFGTPATSQPSSSLSFAAPVTSSQAAPALNFGTTSAPSQTSKALTFGSTVAPTSQTSTGIPFGTTSAPSTQAASHSFASTTSSGLSFGAKTQASAIATSATATSAPSGITALGKSTAATTMPSLTTATTTTAAVPPQTISSITFAQLEENINKWTLELEEQEKTFINQATQINAWDRLLIANGEKIVELNDAVQTVKNEQQSLDHELDFVLAQQKELEDLLTPMEKQLLEDTGDRMKDPEREHMYSLAENLDTQLRQMSEDLKEVIEHLNETNRSQDSNDPIVQIGRILNAHMSSMQWIDNSIAQISTKLDQLKTTHDTLRRDNERSFQLTYN